MSRGQAKKIKKLPLYGPLAIQNHKAFLQEAKTQFFERHKAIYHSDISISDYDFVATLGKGAFGTVKLVKEKMGNNYYAAKIQLKQRIRDNGCSHRVYFEKRVLFSIDFPFCVRMEHYCHDHEAIYFLMPFISGGELYTLIKKFGYFHSDMARFYTAQVVLALEFLQYIHFVFRDLKPENILVDHTGFLKLTDYGLAKEVNYRTFTICGTPAYMAPEVVEGKGYARSADWWSLGVLIFEMVSGMTPFIAKDSVKLFTKILYAPLPMYPFFSPNLKNLLRGLLNKDVTSRLGNLKDGAEGVKKHPWFKSVDWLRLLNRNVKPPYIPVTSGPADTSNFPRASRPLSTKLKTTKTRTSVRKEVVGDKSKVKGKVKRRENSMRDSLFEFSPMI